MKFTIQQQSLIESTNLICKALFQETTLPYSYGAILNGKYMNEGFGFDLFSDSFTEKEITTSPLEINVNEFGRDREKRVSVSICLNGLEVKGLGVDNIILRNDVNAILLSFDSTAAPQTFNELKLTRTGLDAPVLKTLIEKCVSDLGFAKHNSTGENNPNTSNDRMEQENYDYAQKLTELRNLLD